MLEQRYINVTIMIIMYTIMDAIPYLTGIIQFLFMAL